MNYPLVDRYSHVDSFIHRLDPRTRILTTLAFVVAVVGTPPTAWPVFLSYALLIAGLILLARLPLLYALKRSAMIIPFVLMITAFVPFLGRGEVAASYDLWRWRMSVTYEGLTMLWSTLARAWLSILGLILLSATTPFPQLLKGLQRLGVPRVMVMILSFLYRYLFVLLDEAMRMQRARESRSVAPSHPFDRRWLGQMRAVGGAIGALFIRSIERGERVYQAMLARGYDREVRTLSNLRFSRADLIFAASFLLWLVVTGSALYCGQ